MLTIYRASAGAGKTHKLTGEYLLLLFSQPNAYRRILAVTFTNKATDEMKSRIVEELFNLASDRKSDYIASLSAVYQMDEPQIRQQARKILIAILHDYSAFNISTIDRFFQQTMRAFTREIGLQGGYGIEMDQELVLTEAVDRLLASLGNPENKDGKRFNDRFLTAWKNLYALAKYSGPNGERASEAMLDHRVSLRALNGKWVLTCPDIVAAWMNANPDPVTQYLKPLLKNFPLEFRTYKIE